MLIVLMAYASAVLVFVSRKASAALDDRLRSDFEWAAAMADLEPDGTLKWFDNDPDGTREGPWLQAWSAGRVIFRTAVAERNAIPDTERLATRPDQGIFAVSTPRSKVRVLTGVAHIYSRAVVLQVARSEASMREELGQLAILLLLGLPLGVAGAGAGGYFLARKALLPIERMARRAQTITAARLSDRLPVDNPDDELGRLALVFNDTLGRLESSFGQMRQFTADVSHALRTPLTAIRTVGEVSLRGPRDAETYRAVIGSTLEEVDRLTTLVDRLLAMARAEATSTTLSRQPVDLSELVEEVATELRAFAEEKQQVLTVVAHGRPLGVVDRVILRESVVNLVDNAIKYTPEGGQVELRLWDRAAAAVVEVSDTGPGIPDHAQGRIFERFFRGGAALRARDAGGTGLGLSIAKWAVEAHGGELQVRSTSRGTTFRITLPRVAGLPVVPAQKLS